MMKKAKGSYDMSVGELEKARKRAYTMFLLYIGVAIILGLINGFYGVQSLVNVLDINNNSQLFYFLLVLTLISINIMMVLFLWMITETSYYKMLQLHYETLIYLKKKLGE